MKKFFVTIINKYEGLSVPRKVLLVILIILVGMTVWNFIHVAYFVYRYRPFPHRRYNQNATTTDRINTIQPWMSFNYLNFAFRLPPDYLLSVLHVTDDDYPRMVIGSYAKQMKVDPREAIRIIQQAIRSYQESR